MKEKEGQHDGVSLEKEGLVRALQHRLKAVERRAGIENQLIVDGSLELNNEEEEALFHVA